jgi:pimeloyl-ACP methyl ester carboxylesterase
MPVREDIIPGADGLPLAVMTIGEERRDLPTVLLVHGWARTAGYWDGIAAILGTEHRVIVPALRMHGASLALREIDVPVSIPLMVEDMLAILAALDVTSCVAVGHSMGGQIVTLLADRAPDLVSGTVALDPAYGALPDEIDIADERKRDHVDQAVQDFLAEHPSASSSTVERYAHALADLYDSEYLLDHSIGALGATAPVLMRRRRPALAVYATDVGVQTELELTAGAELRPEVVRWTLSGGHDFPAAHPDETAAMITEWIARATSDA